MPDIILLETSTSLCSAALVTGSGEVLYQESDQPRAHASMCSVFVQRLLDEAGLECKDIQAVAVSSGPGSYTGLRVGSSTAKGLCFGAGIPLISVSTPQVLACQAIGEGLVPSGCKYIIPMIDARRMEVYTAVFSANGEPLTGIEAKIIERGCFDRELEDGVCLFIGDGAQKCSEALNHPNAHFFQCCPKASAMAVPAIRAYNEKRFESTAYFEPFYLKDFVATVSRKKLF